VNGSSTAPSAKQGGGLAFVVINSNTPNKPLCLFVCLSGNCLQI